VSTLRSDEKLGATAVSQPTFGGNLRKIWRVVFVVDRLSVGQHARMQDAGNQNAAYSYSIFRALAASL